jgi:cytochrome c biogenesis protein CcmG, thiol:disulfide interchange protein DsbE
MRRYVLPGVVATAAIAVLALLTFGVASQNDDSSIDSLVAHGKFPVAPDAHMSLPVLGGAGRMTLADFRGKVVVVNVFASWCPPCAAEAPLLSREQKLLAGSNATLLGVTYEDNSSSSEAFVHRYHITYPVLRDVSGEFARSLGVNGVPETFVINRQGRIQALQREPVTKKWLGETLPQIVGAAS